MSEKNRWQDRWDSDFRKIEWKNLRIDLCRLKLPKHVDTMKNRQNWREKLNKDWFHSMSLQQCGKIGCDVEVLIAIDLGIGRVTRNGKWMNLEINYQK